MKKEKITVVIPAFNEENQITSMLKAALAAKFPDEVVVIDDGSSDKTAEVSESLGATVIKHNKNKGKGAAVQTAFNVLDSDIICFLDADLINFKSKHVDNIIGPLLGHQELAMSIGNIVEGNFFTFIGQTIMPWISGQRAIRTKYFKEMKNLDNCDFAVETVFTKFVKNHELDYVIVPLRHVLHLRKEQKRGYLKGFLARIKMYYEIISEYRKTD